MVDCEFIAVASVCRDVVIAD